jgi:hypothetical protein
MGAQSLGWRTLVRRTGFKTRLRPLEGALEYAAGETADLVSHSLWVFFQPETAASLQAALVLGQIFRSHPPSLDKR